MKQQLRSSWHRSLPRPVCPWRSAGDAPRGAARHMWRCFWSEGVSLALIVGNTASSGGCRTRPGSVSLGPTSSLSAWNASAAPAGERLYLAAGNGLHRSSDSGRSWKIITSWETMEIMHALADPGDSARLYVGTPWGVYRSIDDGAHWVETMEGMNRWFISDMAMHPGDVSPPLCFLGGRSLHEHRRRRITGDRSGWARADQRLCTPTRHVFLDHCRHRRRGPASDRRWRDALGKQHRPRGRLDLCTRLLE